MQNDEMKKEEIVVPMRFELMTFRLSAGRSNRAKLWDQQVVDRHIEYILFGYLIFDPSDSLRTCQDIVGHGP